MFRAVPSLGSGNWIGLGKVILQIPAIRSRLTTPYQQLAASPHDRCTSSRADRSAGQPGPACPFDVVDPITVPCDLPETPLHAGNSLVPAAEVVGVNAWRGLTEHT